MLWLLLHRLGETVLSDDFPVRSGKQCFFQNTQKLYKSFCSNEVKNESLCFSGRLETENILPPQDENIAFIISADFPSSQIMFLGCFRVV